MEPIQNLVQVLRESIKPSSFLRIKSGSLKYCCDDPLIHKNMEGLFSDSKILGLGAVNMNLCNSTLCMDI